MLEQEMSVELSLGARKIIFVGILVCLLGFAGAVFLIGQPKISLIILGVALAFAVLGGVSLKNQIARDKAGKELEEK